MMRKRKAQVLKEVTAFFINDCSASPVRRCLGTINFHVFVMYSECRGHEPNFSPVIFAATTSRLVWLGAEKMSTLAAPLSLNWAVLTCNRARFIPICNTLLKGPSRVTRCENNSMRPVCVTTFNTGSGTRVTRATLARDPLPHRTEITPLHAMAKQALLKSICCDPHDPEQGRYDRHRRRLELSVMVIEGLKGDAKNGMMDLGRKEVVAADGALKIAEAIKFSWHGLENSILRRGSCTTMVERRTEAWHCCVAAARTLNNCS